MTIEASSIPKRVTWNQVYAFDFSDSQQFKSGFTITAFEITILSGDVVKAEEDADGPLVKVRIGGGSIGTVSRLRCTTDWSNGDTGIDMEGLLEIE